MLRQIEIAVAPEAEDPVHEDESFSTEDARQELERLRKDERPAVAPTDASGMCAIPAGVPYLPEGLRITAEMKQLLSTLLTAGDKRVGFCGMGGIGKTTISTWLVREDSTRKQFAQIVWVALGQEPNLEKLQELVHLELTGNKFDGELTPAERQVVLKQAMAGENLLLVLDDLVSKTGSLLSVFPYELPRQSWTHRAE